MASQRIGNAEGASGTPNPAHNQCFGAPETDVRFFLMLSEDQTSPWWIHRGTPPPVKWTQSNLPSRMLNSGTRSRSEPRSCTPAIEKWTSQGRHFGPGHFSPEFLAHFAMGKSTLYVMNVNGHEFL